MNYYKFNIGDYAAATRHLTMLEHGAYRLLLDLYYTSEQPIPLDLKAAARKAGARSKDEVQAVETVLQEFFTETQSGWTHARCETEIAIYQQKAETNRVVGKKGGRPKKETTAVDSWNPEKTQTVSEINPQETLTTNQEPITSNTPIPPSGASRPAKTVAVSLPTWLVTIKAKGEKALPEDDPVRTYASEVGIPDELMRLAWWEFRKRYSEPDAKRYKDWRAVFRKAVRGNWLKLWHFDGGEYRLTTVGHQAEAAMGVEA